MPRRGWPHGAAASRGRGRPPLPKAHERLTRPAPRGSARLRRAPSPVVRPRALGAAVLAGLLARYRRRHARYGSARLRSAAYALRRARLAGDVLHERDGALDHERDWIRL